MSNYIQDWQNRNNPNWRKRRQKQNKWAMRLLYFFIVWVISTPFAIRAPIIPNPWLKANLGWLTSAICTSVICYWLFICKDEESGRNFFMHAWTYNAKNIKEKFYLVLAIPFSITFSWIYGLSFVHILAMPSMLYEGTVTHDTYHVVALTQGERWYRGITKVGIERQGEAAYGVYWPNAKAKQLRLGDTIYITRNHTVFGTHIESIAKADP